MVEVFTGARYEWPGGRTSHKKSMKSVLSCASYFADLSRAVTVGTWNSGVNVQPWREGIDGNAASVSM